MQGHYLSFGLLATKLMCSLNAKCLLIVMYRILVQFYNMFASNATSTWSNSYHDDVIKRKHFSRCWPIVRGIRRWPVNSPHKGQWRGALIFCLLCVGINDWVNNRKTGDLRRHRGHYDVIVMTMTQLNSICIQSISHSIFITIPWCDYNASANFCNAFRCRMKK